VSEALSSAGFGVNEMEMDTHRISIAQLVDVTGQGVFRFRVEVATSCGLDGVPRNLSYSLDGLDEVGRELYVSAWLDLGVVLKEVERISEGLKACGKFFVVSSVVEARVVDQVV
jgi:hypothetical protein